MEISFSGTSCRLERLCSSQTVVSGTNFRFICTIPASNSLQIHVEQLIVGQLKSGSDNAKLNDRHRYGRVAGDMSPL